MAPLGLEGLSALAPPVPLGPPSGASTLNDFLGLGSPLDWLLRPVKQGTPPETVAARQGQHAMRLRSGIETGLLFGIKLTIGEACGDRRS
jgi:hypothetical protein